MTELATGIGQPGADDPAVRVAPATLDQPGLGELVDGPGQRRGVEAGAQAEPTQRLAILRPEQAEDVELGRRDRPPGQRRRVELGELARRRPDREPQRGLAGRPLRVRAIPS
jgi:hypothetical protein